MRSTLRLQYFSTVFANHKVTPKSCLLVFNEYNCVGKIEILIEKEMILIERVTKSEQE